MKDIISPQDFNTVSTLIADILGLHFPPEKWPDLERALREAAKDFHFKSVAMFIDWFSTTHLNQSQLEILASHFTIGETYFFRDPAYFELLENWVLPPLIEARRRTEKILRFWSAGCSSGEEPYSLAILLCKLIHDISEWNITILASDINMESQNKLITGIYSEWSFRTADARFKERYFNKVDNHHYQILPKIKKLVTPIYLNLVSDVYPSLLNNTNAMDIIFCRNVLMYFVPDKAAKVIENLGKSLIEEGYFFVSGSEYHLVQNPHLKTIHNKGLSYYQKTLDPQKGVLSPQPVFLENISVPDLSTEVSEVEFTFDINDNIEPSNLMFYDLEQTIETKSQTVPEPIAPASDYNTESLARTLADRGELHQALELLDQGIIQDKCNKHLYYLKSLILLELGSLPEAVKELQKTLYLDPNFVLPYFTLGNIARSQNNGAEAKKAFSIVLSLLKNYAPDEILPGSDGVTAARMHDIVALLG